MINTTGTDSSSDFTGWLLQPGGSIFCTTISRTLRSYALTIVMAEYVFGVVQRGVHDWNKFLRPDELKHLISQSIYFYLCKPIWGAM